MQALKDKISKALSALGDVDTCLCGLPGASAAMGHNRVAVHALLEAQAEIKRHQDYLANRGGQ